MKRILVIGSGGAGKSTIATKLGELLDIEVIRSEASSQTAATAHS